MSAVPEVGDPIVWTIADVDDADAPAKGRGQSHDVEYWVAKADDVWRATEVTQVVGHLRPRPHSTHLRFCLTRDSAMKACQDSEHRMAWSRLSDTAKSLLLAKLGGAP